MLNKRTLPGQTSFQLAYQLKGLKGEVELNRPPKRQIQVLEHAQHMYLYVEATQSEGPNL